MPVVPNERSSNPLEALRGRGFRLTRQRELVFRLIHNSRRHLNAHEIYELAALEDPKINQVTIYRTLKVLKEQGLIDELDLMHYEGEQHYYETRLKREHAHLVCLGCGSVFEYFGDPLREMKAQIETQFGFQVEVARTEFGGYCADCQKSGQARASADAAQARRAASLPAAH
ncbi:MAG: Fur family transcriptional regulator [Bryobacterales bacterium]|nr:Fur family transcriptional regulator [Bryobacterales bacterium]